MDTAALELKSLMQAEELRDSALLVYANKQDMPGALSTAEIREKLYLESYKGREWRIQGCCASTGDGLYEGLDWVASVTK